MGATCTVASKLPWPLRLRVFKMEGVRRAGPSGPVTVQEAREVGAPVVVKGCATHRGVDLQLPNAKHTSALVGGYALTSGVDLDFMNEWLKANADSDIVKNHLVFIHEKQDFAEGRAKEQEKLASGFEPIVVGDPGDPVRDPRAPRGLQTAQVK